MRTYSASRVAVRDLEVHDTVVLAGPETLEDDQLFSLHYMGELDTLFGEVMDARESQGQDKIKMRVATSSFAYLLDVECGQKFLTVTPALTPAEKVKAGDRIIMRGEVAPEAVGGKPAHTDLVLSRGAVSKVLKTWTLRDGTVRLTVLLGRKKRFKFEVEPEKILEVL